MQRLVELTGQRTGGGAPLDPGLMEMHGPAFGAAQEAMPALSETVGARGGGGMPPPPVPPAIGVEFQGGDIETGSYGYAAMDTPRAAPVSGGAEGGILSRLGLPISKTTVYIIVVVVAALFAGLTYILCQTGKLSSIVGKYMGKMTGKEKDDKKPASPPSKKSVSFELPSEDQAAAERTTGSDKKKKRKAAKPKKQKKNDDISASTVTGGGIPDEFPMARPPSAQPVSDEGAAGAPLSDDPLWTPL